MLALFYDLAEDYLERRGALREEHLALARAAHERGELLLAGAFSEPYDRALLVWATEDEAVVVQFVEADPYVRNGLVVGSEIRKWAVAIGG
ncbi:MAG TPA: YciI-like protein [Mycobacteriales bacterium]|jgi:hypothetical protein|nr:YciI-like protein [Mycobacteriales bacterium]